MFEKPCARETIQRFFNQWLWLDRLGGLNKDSTIFPNFSDETRKGMQAEENRFFEELFWKNNAKLADIYNSDRVWPHPQSAFIYGFDNVLEQEERTLDSTRSGVLSHPALLSVTGRFSDTSPVKRGVFVLEQILCKEPRPVPQGLEITPPDPDPSLTTRERWAAHSSSPGCAGCHKDMDPIGFAFEGFDSIGVYRTMENSRPVDTRGGAPLIGIEDGEIDGAAEFSRVIATSPFVASCFAKQWLRFSLGRPESEQDSSIDVKVVDEMRERLRNKSMKEAMMGLLESQVLTYRIEEKEGE